MADRGSSGGRGRGGRGRSASGGDRGRGSTDRGRGTYGDRGRGTPGDRGRGRGGIGHRPGAAPVTVFRQCLGIRCGSQPNVATPAPDAAVTNLENEYAENVANNGLPDLSRLSVGVRYPPRPGYGKRGNPVILWANYFHLVSSSRSPLYRYSIAISPDVKGKKAKRVIQLLLGSAPFAPIRNGVATDFRSTLISVNPLNDQRLDNRIAYLFEDEDEPRPNATNYRVQLQSTGTLSVSDLMLELTTNNANNAYAHKLDTIQALNIILGHYGKSQPSTVTLGRNRFYPLGTAKFDLGGCLQALRGFSSSVRAATSRILVNINVSHAVFYEAIPLNDLIFKFGKTYGPNLYRLNKFLRLVRIRTTHLPERKNRAGVVIPRVKTILGVAAPGDGQGMVHPPRMPPNMVGGNSQQVEFWIGDDSTPPSDPKAGAEKTASKGKGKGKGKGKSGEAPTSADKKPHGQLPSNQYISVFDFFKRAYNITLIQPQFPVLNVGTRQNPSYLPSEVCVVLPGQNSLSKLDPEQTAQMIRIAVRRPQENASSIATDGAQAVGISTPANTTLQSFGISITAKMITVPGRTLGPPTIRYKNNKPVSPADGSWNLRDCLFRTGSSTGSWGVLQVMNPGGSGLDGRLLDRSIADLKRELGKLGVSSPELSYKRMVTPDTRDDDLELENCFRDAASKLKTPSMLLVILPNKDAATYQCIKYLGDVKFGINTICSIGSMFTKERNQQYFANLALKFNLKRGGSNHGVDPLPLGLISEDKTMLVGIDVTHPSPDSSPTAPSVAGMVASIDKFLGQWPAELRIQASRQERVSDLDTMLTSRLSLWRTLGKHQNLPENILVYRDGVSEGQYGMVVNEELPLLRKACDNIYPATETKKGRPHISIVVVGKRHHTRFYPTKVEDASRSGNPRNGTVVDRGVTEKSNWDFYLQAHSALQGTARPAHYYVVHDEIFTNRPVKSPHQNAADALEELTHNLCYLYGRATKAVSICPPAYYADLVCERARCYLRRHFTSSTPGQSVLSGSQGGDDIPRAEDVTVHPNLRNSMFYI